MALYTPFGELLAMFRSEARLSTNPAVNAAADTRHKQMLNRVYQTLYDSYAWPHLRFTTRPKDILAGERFYDLPDGVNADRMEQIVTWQHGVPYPLDPGIGFEEYGTFDSEAGERADPPQRYALRANSHGATQIEIWPVPATDATLQVTGIRSASKMVNPSDICLIDDLAVVLFAAAEALVATNKEEAERKDAAAKARLVSIRANSVSPQTAGSSAPKIGTGASVSLHRGRAHVTIARTP